MTDLTMEALGTLYGIGLDVANEIDRQSYEERRRANFDQPDDADLTVNITAGQFRRLCVALHKAAIVLPDSQENK
jgi:hypothetical protein